MPLVRNFRSGETFSVNGLRVKNGSGRQIALIFLDPLVEIEHNLEESARRGRHLPPENFFGKDRDD